MGDGCMADLIWAEGQRAETTGEYIMPHVGGVRFVLQGSLPDLQQSGDIASLTALLLAIVTSCPCWPNVDNHDESCTLWLELQNSLTPPSHPAADEHVWAGQALEEHKGDGDEAHGVYLYEHITAESSPDNNMNLHLASLRQES